MEKEERLVTKGVTLFFTMIALFLSATIFFIAHTLSHGDNSISLDKTYLNIDYAGFDTRITLAEITSIEWLTALPEGGKRGGGIEDRRHIAGDAYFKEIGSCHAYVMKDVPAFLYITSEKGCYLINDPDQEKTEQIYHALLKIIKADKAAAANPAL